MQFECIKCGGHFYGDEDKFPTKCPYCGSRFFRLLKKEEEFVENFLILKPGVYKINVKNILERDGVFVIKTKEGEYHITLT